MNRRRTYHGAFVLIHLLVTVAIVTTPARTPAQPFLALPNFTITGHFTREVKTVPLIQRTGFKIVSHGGRWKITTDALQPETSPNAIRSASFDFDGWTVTASVGPSSDDFIPPAWSSYVPEQLWLAYLSGPYFVTNTSPMARPVWHLDDKSLIKKGFLVQTRREPLQSGLGQPRIVEFISDGKVRFNREGRSEVRPYPPPFDSGFVQAVFQVNSVSNVAGINFPKEFTFEQYGPRPEKPEGRMEMTRLVITRGYTETITFDTPPPPERFQWKNPKPFDLANPEYQKALENSAPPSKPDAINQF